MERQPRAGFPMLPPLLSPKAKSSCFASWSTSTGQGKLLVQGEQTGVRRGNRLSQKQPAGKKPVPFSTLANGLVHLGLVSSLGLGEWWKCKSCESQIQGRGRRNNLGCPRVHNQRLSGYAGAVDLGRLYGAWYQRTLAMTRSSSISADKILGLWAGSIWITTPLFIRSSLVKKYLSQSWSQPHTSP